jgi:ppGpp synthetase/RelA/SpoT-type nucleotidyltranferase
VEGFSRIQRRAKGLDSLGKKLTRGILATASLKDDIKDLAGCRLIFYTNADVTRFRQSGKSGSHASTSSSPFAA